MSRYLIATKANIEKGLYKDARDKGRTLSAHLQLMADQGHIAPELYNPEARDSQGRPVGAFRQLMGALGIRTRGAYGAQSVEEVFLRDNTNRVMFPEWINSVYRDLEKQPRNELTVADLVLTRTPITGGVYLYGLIQDQSEDGPARVSEAADLPLYNIKTTNQAIRIYKYGGRMRVSYETVRQSSLDVVGRWIERIRRRAERAKVADALEVAINGDGNSNAATGPADLAGTTYTIDDLIDLVVFAAGKDAEPNIIAGDLVELAKLLKLDFVKDAASTAAGADFRDTGMWPRILGMQPKRVPARSVLSGAKTIVAIDSSLGLEMAYDPTMELTESDRLIENQTEVVTFSEAQGFGKPDPSTAFTLEHA